VTNLESTASPSNFDLTKLNNPADDLVSLAENHEVLSFREETVKDNSSKLLPLPGNLDLRIPRLEYQFEDTPFEKSLDGFLLFQSDFGSLQR